MANQLTSSKWKPLPRNGKECKTHLVEMSWDPITRIVGSLGIFTKIDFANRKVAECHSTSSIFRGYSIFMKTRIPATPTSSLQPNLRDLRRQSCDLFSVCRRIWPTG